MRDAIERYVGDAIAADLLSGENGTGRLCVEESGNRLTLSRAESTMECRF
jgi:hypothetical protein